MEHFGWLGRFPHAGGRIQQLAELALGWGGLRSQGLEMKPMVHSLYPIGETGGPQRLLGESSSKGSIRVQMGPRICTVCGSESPHIRCHKRPDPNVARECGGRTEVRKRRGGNRRRKGSSPLFQFHP